MSQKAKITVQELKSILKDLKYPTSGNKNELIERLGWANMPQSFDIFSDYSTNDVLQGEVNFKKEGPVFKRIPKGSRLQCCKAFKSLFDQVTEKNDKCSWEKLFNFACCGIGSSKRGGKASHKQQS